MGHPNALSGSIRGEYIVVTLYEVYIFQFLSKHYFTKWFRYRRDLYLSLFTATYYIELNGTRKEVKWMVVAEMAFITLFGKP